MTFPHCVWHCMGRWMGLNRKGEVNRQFSVAQVLIAKAIYKQFVFFPLNWACVVDLNNNINFYLTGNDHIFRLTLFAFVMAPVKFQLKLFGI